MFNANDLDGWTIKFGGFPVGENYRDTFRMKDGVLKVDFSQWDSFNGEFGHIYTDEDYTAYDLRFEYRHIGEQVPGAPDWALRNNGVMLHAQAPETMAFEQGFPRCVEVQLLTAKLSEGDTRSNGNICTPGTYLEVDGVFTKDHCIPSGKAVTEGEDWTEVLVEVDPDGQIRQYIDGEMTLSHSGLVVQAGDPMMPDSEDPEGTPITSGRIAFQAESHPTEFRNVEIRVR